MQIMISFYFYRKSSVEAIYLIMFRMNQITGKHKDDIIILFSFPILNSIQE